MSRDGMDDGCGGDMEMGMGNACWVYPDAPPTPGLVTPDVRFVRGIYMNGSMTMDDGNCVALWGFTDEADDGGMGGHGHGHGGGMGQQPFPSPAIRVREGQIVHTELRVEGQMWLHTIHHHGIEPNTENDGVGHTSFDVDDTYIYQWRPRYAGTYFYHCHTNTVLHAELGMYGALIVDPPEGPGRVFDGGPRYDREVVWACDEIDSRWHTLPWDAGTCGEDVGLHLLEPDYFIITGVDGAGSALNAPGVAVDMIRGETLLVRYINAGYYAQRIRFGGLEATVVASDGRALPRPIKVKELTTGSAERYDCLFTPDRAGEYIVECDFLHWSTGKVLGTARTRITVA